MCCSETSQRLTKPAIASSYNASRPETSGAFVRVRLDNRGRSKVRNAGRRLLKMHRWDRDSAKWIRARPELDASCSRRTNSRPSPTWSTSSPHSDRLIDLASVDRARVADRQPALYIEIGHPWAPNEALGSASGGCDRVTAIRKPTQGEGRHDNGDPSWAARSGGAEPASHGIRTARNPRPSHPRADRRYRPRTTRGAQPRRENRDDARRHVLVRGPLVHAAKRVPAPAADDRWSYPPTRHPRRQVLGRAARVPWGGGHHVPTGLGAGSEL